MKLYTNPTIKKYALLTILLGMVMMMGACSDNPGFSESNTSKYLANNDKYLTNNNFGASANSRAAVDLEVTSQHDHETNEHLFELSANSISAGWTTIKFNNASHSDHFVLIYKVPQQAILAAKSADETVLQHWYKGVTVPFQEEFNPYITGTISYGDFVNNLISTIATTAPWFLSPGATTMGGPGITSAGQISTTTVKLDPGMYIVECYVKDENQEFHSYNGMLDILEVKDTNSDEAEPKATMDVSITQNGLEIPERIRPGLHTVRVNYGDQPPYGYEHLLGHNAQLVRFDEGYNQSLLDELSEWMDWTNSKGLIHRAPEGISFLGGSMEMPGGFTSYYNVVLKPGKYAWIAEVPNPEAKNMLKTFTVPSQNTKESANPLRQN